MEASWSIFLPSLARNRARTALTSPAARWFAGENPRKRGLGRGQGEAGRLAGVARAEGGGRTQSSPPGGCSLHQPAGSRSAAGPLPPHPTPAARPLRSPGSSWCGAAASGAPAWDRSGRRRRGHLRCTLTSATPEQASTPSWSPFVQSPHPLPPPPLLPSPTL